MTNDNKSDQSTSSTNSGQFKLLIKEAIKVVDNLIKANPNIDRHELSLKLNTHFPGLFDLSKELSRDMSFLAEMGAHADIQSVMNEAKSPEQAMKRIQLATELHQSQYALLHRDGVRFALVLGLELGYILANLYNNKSSKDDEFDKFMKSLGMDSPTEGSIQ